MQPQNTKTTQLDKRDQTGICSTGWICAKYLEPIKPLSRANDHVIRDVVSMIAWTTKKAMTTVMRVKTNVSLLEWKACSWTATGMKLDEID